MNAAIFSLKNVTTGYRQHQKAYVVTPDLCQDIRAGEMTVLLGINGSGKSTLLRTLAGRERPLCGDIRLDGRPLTDYTPVDLARKVSVVLTRGENYGGNLTVQETVELGRTPYTGFWGRVSSHDKEIAQQALRLTDSLSLSERKMHTLSDGERQKVMVARALAQKTPVILLDEPTSYLDFGSKVEIFRLLSLLAREEGKTIVLSTHSMQLALQTADKLWLFRKGESIAAGTPRELAERGMLEKMFENKGVLFDRESLTYTLRETRS